jgi:thymidine kinase
VGPIQVPQWPSLDQGVVASLPEGWLSEGCLLFFHGPMSSGKSALAIKLAQDLSTTFRVRTFSAGKVERTRIASRDGQRVPAEWLSPTTQIPSAELIAEKSVIVIDEAQFLIRSQVMELQSLSLRHSLAVICVGLAWSAEGKIFAGAAALLLCGAFTRPIPHDLVCWCGARAVADAFATRSETTHRYISVCLNHATISES